MKGEFTGELPEAFPPVPILRHGVYALCGLACAGLILAALAFSRATHVSEAQQPEIYVAHQVALPFDEPPPARELVPPQCTPIVGPIRLEVAATASSVHIQVPDEPLLAVDHRPPPARAAVAARFDLAQSAVRPTQDDGDLAGRRIFSRNEVDQRPMVLQRVTPNINFAKVRQMATPRVVLLLAVNTDGSVGDVRLMRGSKDEDFDLSVIDAIHEWRFSPAIRKGRKVRCWVEQGVSVNVTGGTPFEAQ